MLKRCLLVSSVVLSLVAFTDSASALKESAQEACTPTSLMPAAGASDNVDILFGNPNTYNLNRMDAAIVCVDYFNASNGISLGDTAAYVQELANVASHEFGHVLGLRHRDSFDFTIANYDPLALMTVVDPFDGTNRSWKTTDELAVMNALTTPVQIVWLDFEAASSELLAKFNFEPWSNSPTLVDAGVTDALAAQDAIVQEILSDFMGSGTNGAWGSGATFEFYLMESDASAAASSAGLAADEYSTVSFVSNVPEPTTGLLVMHGLIVIAWSRTNQRIPRPS